MRNLTPFERGECEEGRRAAAKDRSTMTASASMEACLSMFFLFLLKCRQESQATVRVSTAIYVNVSKALYVNSCPLIDSPLLLRLLGLLVEHGGLSDRGRGEHGRSGNMHAVIGNHAAGLGGVGEVLVERIPTVPLAKVGSPPEAGAYPNTDDGDDDDDEEDDPLVVVVHPGRCIVSYNVMCEQLCTTLRRRRVVCERKTVAQSLGRRSKSRWKKNRTKMEHTMCLRRLWPCWRQQYLSTLLLH